MTGRTHRNALDEGHKLHWYKIEKILGEGGFGITYLALDANLDRQVAIKEYLPSDLATREKDSTLQPISEDRQQMYTWGLDRFHKEAKTLAKFSHPNVVRVYNVFRANNTAYMVMEFEYGDSLELLIKENQLSSEADALNLLFPLLDALENVHHANIIHRDIKPANIYIRNNGSPVLLDFGSARIAMGTKTRTLTSVVSPGFAPFEQYNPEGTKQGPWTDIYALGATLYAIVAGRGPLDAIVRGQARLEGKEGILIPAAEIGKDRYSNQFLTAIDRSLEFMPKDRPQSIAEWRSMFPGQPSTPVFTAVHEEDIPTVISEEHKPATETRVFDTHPSTADKPRTSVKRISAYILLLLIVAGGIFLGQGGEWQQWLEVITPGGSQQEIERIAAEKAAQERAIQREKEEALHLAEERNRAKDKLQFDRLMQEAKSASQAGDSELAIKMLELALSLYPDDVIAKLNLQREKDKIKQSEEHSTRVKQLLSQADGLLKSNKLGSPPGDNAAERYKQVLQIAPNHRKAIDGLKKITNKYVSMANAATSRDDFSKASGLLSTALDILPMDSIFDDSRGQLAASRNRLNTRKGKLQKDRQRQTQLAREQQLKEQARLKAERQAEVDKQNRFERLISEAKIALNNEEKDLAIEKYSEALNIFPTDQRAISGLGSARKMTYKACKQIVGAWLWSVGTTLTVNADGTCRNSFLFVSLPCSWTCTDGKERKFEFNDQHTYIVTMSKDGSTLYSQGLTARRKAVKETTNENDDDDFSY